MNAALVVAFIAAVAGPLGAYIVAARRFSGKIESSEASDLWVEVERQRQYAAQQLKDQRDWSQQRIDSLSADVERLERRVVAVEQSNTDLSQKNRDLIAEVHELKQTISGLRGDVEDVQGKLDRSRARVIELEAQVTEMEGAT